MSADPNTTEHIQQLSQMKEHYLSKGSALPLDNPIGREALRVAAIIGSIDQLIRDLRR
jgi:hypothetical protein